MITAVSREKLYIKLSLRYKTKEDYYSMGNTLIFVGIGLIATGIAYKFGLLGWFGHLPGDIRYESEHTFVFIPITSMLLVSAVLSLIMWLAER